MYCKYCGNQIVDDAYACVHCGRLIGAAPEQTEDQNPIVTLKTEGLSYRSVWTCFVATLSALFAKLLILCITLITLSALNGNPASRLIEIAETTEALMITIMLFYGISMILSATATGLAATDLKQNKTNLFVLLWSIIMLLVSTAMFFYYISGLIIS